MDDSDDVYACRTLHPVFSEPFPAVSKFLLQSLKGKKMLPDDITNTYVELFERYHSEAGSPTKLMDYFVGILEELSKGSVPPVIGKSLIAAVRYYVKKEGTEDWFPSESIANMFVSQWKSLNPMLLGAISSLISPSSLPSKSELISYAIENWQHNKQKEAVFFSVDFNIHVTSPQHEFESATNAIASLISENKVDILMHLIRGDVPLVMKTIPLLTTNQHIKTAGKLIEDNNLNPSDFPSVILRMKKVAVRYFVNSHDIEISQLVELLSDDIDCMTILMEELEFKCNS